jgi:hypothetical protein
MEIDALLRKRNSVFGKARPRSQVSGVCGGCVSDVHLIRILRQEVHSHRYLEERVMLAACDAVPIQPGHKHWSRSEVDRMDAAKIILARLSRHGWFVHGAGRLCIHFNGLGFFGKRDGCWHRNWAMSGEPIQHRGGSAEMKDVAGELLCA